jgi:hypothetical protein
MATDGPPGHAPTLAGGANEDLRGVTERLAAIESSLAELHVLLSRQHGKEWYTTEEVAKILGKATFTVREWCRHGRVHCCKQSNGRGKHQSWVVSREEVLRIEREGLFPLERTSSSIT